MHRDKKASDILKETYKSARDNCLEDTYYFDCKDGFVNFRRYEENNTFRGVIANAYLVDSFRFIKGFEVSHSIEDMKNRVQLYLKESANKNTLPNRLLTRGRQEDINRFGLLNHIEEVEKNTNLGQTIENKLRELSRVKETLSLTLHGDYNLHKGVITRIENPILNLRNRYRIDSTEHTIQGTTEYVKIMISLINTNR